MDFAAAAKITGARYVVLHHQLARLHRALAQFMLDKHISEHGYREVYVPFIVNAQSLYGTGQLPKFAQDQFKVDADVAQYLIPTAEVPVTNIYRDSNCVGGSVTHQTRLSYPLFPQRSGFSRQGYTGDDPPTPI